MTTTRTTPADWPTQVLLPGQAAAPAGPVDMTMMYVMHHAFRRDLAAFVSAGTATPLGDRTTWRALAKRWELFAVALHHHHSGEDAGLWPLLMSRADADARQVLEAMEAEHSEIDPILEACAAGLARLAATGDHDARAALVVRLAAGQASLARHLAHEETEAIALIQQLMTNAEWHQLEEEHFKPKDLSPRTLLRLLPWVMHALPQSARRQLFGAAPTAQRIAWLATRPGFERSERRTFRYARS
jgi:hypothetical protein